MKIRLTFKSPDSVWHGLKDTGIDPNEIPDDIEEVLSKWVRYQEYVTIELDSETGEAVVIQQK